MGNNAIETWNVPPAFNFARDVIDGLETQNRLALLFVDAMTLRTAYTFSDIATISRRWAGLFRDLGIRPGERVIVLLPKVPAWIFAMLALDRLGAVVVPCAEQLRARDLAFRANHSEATTIIAHARNAAEVDHMRAEAPGVTRYLLTGGELAGWTALDTRVEQADEFSGYPTQSVDLALIVYTSGTTKDPKGVMHTHAYTFALRMQACSWLDACPEDLVWCTAGTGWAKSLWNVLFGPWSCGAAIVLHEAAFDAAQRLDIIRNLEVTVLCQAPTEYRFEAKLESLSDRWSFPKLRHCVSAGEPLNPEVIAVWKSAFGITILDGYGQTENSLLVANFPGMDVRPGSMGKPTTGYDVLVVDADGNEAPRGEIGDIGLRGKPPTLFTGYYKNDIETQASYSGDIGKAG
jgi:acetyl-CoA synthetase/medium-chain acyl-CoA synthetase